MKVHRELICQLVSSMLIWHCVAIIWGGRTFHTNWFGICFNMANIFRKPARGDKEE